jgi:hypothetical protein
MPYRDQEINELSTTYGIYRGYIQHEDTLINHRITWMLTIHGFLYATYGFTLQKLLEINEKVSAVMSSKVGNELNCYLHHSPLWSSISQILAFLGCICLVGLVISVTALNSIAAAYNAASAVVRLFSTHVRPQMYSLPDETRIHIYEFQGKMFPFLTAGGFSHGERRGFTAAWSIPTVLIFSWIISAGFLEYEARSEWEIFKTRDTCVETLQAPAPTAPS